MPRGNDRAEYTIHGEPKLTETVWIKRAASLTARFSSIKCNNYEGQWSFRSGVFNLSYRFSIINSLITVSILHPVVALQPLSYILWSKCQQNGAKFKTQHWNLLWLSSWLTGFLTQAQTPNNNRVLMFSDAVKGLFTSAEVSLKVCFIFCCDVLTRQLHFLVIKANVTINKMQV